jgi:hypothetical protein
MEKSCLTQVADRNWSVVNSLIRRGIEVELFLSGPAG